MTSWPELEPMDNNLVNYGVTDNGIAIIELASDSAGGPLEPDKIGPNTYTHEMMRDIDSAVVRARFDDDVHVIIITGHGEKFFSAGASIQMLDKVTPGFKYNFCLHANETLSRLEQTPKLVIAAMNGHAVGGGLEIAACCDLRICSESSRFGAPINRLGLTMSYTELGPIVEVVGASGTLEVLLEGGLLDAERAYQKGFVNWVVPGDDVEDEARATAQRIAAGAPLVNRWHKKFVRRLVGGGGPLTEDERQEAYEAFQTDDYREGVQAFLEGRDPRFEGK